jgi:holo-[acyl-carrier protein] synthase
MVALTLWALALMKHKIENTINKLNTGNNFAIGNDLVFLPEFKHSLTNLFKNKVYTPAELDYCNRFDNSLLHYASTWAAKEAVYKALKQMDTAKLGWKKLEILREKIGGKPSVINHSQPGKFNISLSISHDGDYAWAVAFVTANPGTA